MNRQLSLLLVAAATVAGADVPFAHRPTWHETLRATRPMLRALAEPRSAREKQVWDAFWQRLAAEFPDATADGLSRSLPLPPPIRPTGTSFHVATDGNNANPGTPERPFRTLGRARDAIRHTDKNQPTTVWLHAGIYYLEQPFRLGVQDSGTAENPVTYRAMPGQKVVLSGGQPVTGWRKGPNGIWSADLPAARDSRFGQPLHPRILRYDAPDVNYTGTWIKGEDWRHDGNSGKGQKTASFRIQVPRDGEYAIYTRWHPFGNRAKHVPVAVRHADGTTVRFIDQTRADGACLLGRFRLTAKEAATVTFSNRGTEGYVAVEQVEWLPVEEMERTDAWRFHQLFVNGRRETLARYPNEDLADTRRKGWLYVAEGNRILAGLGQPGDWAEYTLRCPKTANYSLWIGTATTFEAPNRYLRVALDDREIPLADLPCSNDWRRTAFGKAAQLEIAAGAHKLRVESIAPATDRESLERRVHLDAFLFSDQPTFHIGPDRTLPPMAESETRFALEAEDEDALLAMETHFGPRTFPVGKGRGRADRFPMPREDFRPAWANAPQAEVFLFATWGWFNTITRLDRIEDHGGGDRLWVYLAGREARTPVWDGNRYYLMNIRSELDTPGEWFLDYRSGQLDYLPRPGQSPNQCAIVAPRLSRLVELVAPSDAEERVEHVTFQGLEFRHADATRDHPAWRSTEDCAILLENAWNCTIRDCTFTNIGGYAVRLSLDSCLNRIVGNEISETGAGGILLRGPWVGWGANTLSPEPAASILSPLGNLIDHNHIHHCGRIKKYVAGIHVETRPSALAYAPGNVYRHNHIHHLPRNGIFGFRNLGGYVVEQNHIHDVLQESDDGGLVHFCTNALNGTAPALIRRNLLHDVVAFRQDDVWFGRTGQEAAANGHGVYLDGYTSYVTVEQNVIRNTRKGGVFIHDGQNNTVRNNVILDDRARQFWQTKSWNNRWERNLVSWTGNSPLLASFLVEESEEAPRHPELVDHNLYWHAGAPIELTGFADFAAWQTAGFDAHSLVADPRVTALDLPAKRLDISPESPLHQLGFQSIDLSQVGVLPPGARR